MRIILQFRDNDRDTRLSQDVDAYLKATGKSGADLLRDALQMYLTAWRQRQEIAEIRNALLKKARGEGKQ